MEQSLFDIILLLRTLKLNQCIMCYNLCFGNNLIRWDSCSTCIQYHNPTYINAFGQIYPLTVALFNALARRSFSL